ncbi:MAG: O-antigen ligase family protein [Bacteroidales bacterium]|nr:MAG: O-antigen ligase family protein [Bacteroidales bacterium]
MLKRRYEIEIVGVSTLFILANAYFTVGKEFLFNGLPILLIVLFLLLFSVKQLFYTLVFLVPLSVPLYRLVPGLDFDFWFPTEPIIFCILILLILKSIKERYFDHHLTGHPVFWSIIFYLSWLLICIFPSEMPLVSTKYLLVRIWFIGVFFYLGYTLFKSNIKYFKFFLWAFIAGLFIVVSLTLIKHIGRGIFDQKQAHGACTPFFIDHTSYGATIAFLIPLVVGLIFIVETRLKKSLFTLLSIFFLLALVFSYSRAAWLSILVAGAIWLIWFIRIKFSIVAAGFILTLALFFTFQFEIKQWLSSNTTDSSGNLKEHLNSALNVSTDASNLERINRWNAATRMFEERPMFGWGPGTYMFCYAPFQRSYDRTIISTNLGTGGNAHSEYLGLLSEAGVFGAVSYVLILLIVFYRGFYILRKVDDRNTRILIIGSLLGLATYAVHGVLNDFLDADKIAAPFWGFIAFIVAMDIRFKQGDAKS